MTSCQICGKTYIRMGSLRRHLVTCEILNTNKKLTETPTLNDMYDILKQVIKENKVLKRKVKNLENKVYKKKQKKDILDWLNENMCDNINLKDWCNKLEVMRDDLEYMLSLIHI